MTEFEFLDIMHRAEMLKNNTRHSWTSQDRHESVAEHSWRLALTALFLRDEFPALDMDRVIRMCLIHDLGECFTGDIPSFLKSGGDEERERSALETWVASLPAPYSVELKTLYAEMDALETDEARLYKALDKLEAVIQHNESDIATWLPRESDLRRRKRGVFRLSQAAARGGPSGDEGQDRGGRTQQTMKEVLLYGRNGT